MLTIRAWDTHRTWIMKLLCLMAVVLVSALAIQIARACGSGGNCLNPHAYAQQASSVTQYGLYFSNHNGQEDLSVNWANNPQEEWSFITKEGWEIFPTAAQGKQWIEVGAIKGFLKTKGYWSGHFVFFQKCQPTCIYQGYTYGSQNPTGIHNYEIQYIGNNYWRAYVDFNTVQDFWFPYTSNSLARVGLETTDSDSTFVNGTNQRAIEYKDQNNVWRRWQSASNQDQNGLGWRSTFNYDSSTNTNRVTYSR